MELTKEKIEQEFRIRMQDAFALPECMGVKVREIVIERTDSKEIQNEKIAKIMEESYHDKCSDIDLSVRVKLSPQDLVTPEIYMQRIDRFGVTKENYLGLAFVPESRMYRIILRNGMRYDFGFDFEMDDAADLVNLGGQTGSGQTESGQEELINKEDNPDWPLVSIDRFWFVQIQALGKLYRKDHLIADHLANMNINETLVMQMVLRDLKYGTNHHRYGYEEELVYVENQKKECPYKIGNPIADSIAAKLYTAAISYEQLAIKFYKEYQPRREALFKIWDEYQK